MKKDKSEPAKTVLTIVIGFGIVFLISQNLWFLYIGLSLGTLGLLSSFLAKVIDVIWMKLAHMLSFIVPNILLTLIFFLLLFPLALLSKIFKKNDQMMLSNNSKSTFINTNKNLIPKALNNHGNYNSGITQ